MITVLSTIRHDNTQLDKLDVSRRHCDFSVILMMKKYPQDKSDRS